MRLMNESVNITNVSDNSSTTSQVQLIWHVGLKEDTPVDVFIQSFNFWIQVKTTTTSYSDIDITTYHSDAEYNINPLNASCSKLLLFEGSSAILV